MTPARGPIYVPRAAPVVAWERISRPCAGCRPRLPAGTNLGEAHAQVAEVAAHGRGGRQAREVVQEVVIGVRLGRAPRRPRPSRQPFQLKVHHRLLRVRERPRPAERGRPRWSPRAPPPPSPRVGTSTVALRAVRRDGTNAQLVGGDDFRVQVADGGGVQPFLGARLRVCGRGRRRARRDAHGRRMGSAPYGGAEAARVRRRRRAATRTACARERGRPLTE